MASNEIATDVALMLRVRDDDLHAFETLHMRFQRKLLRFFFGMTRDAGAASDLTQETFLRIWKVRHRYQAIGSAPGYVFGIARLVWLEHCRKATRARTSGLVANEAYETQRELAASRDLADTACGREIRDALDSALTKLPEEQRLVFVMRSIEGLALEDIAQALDCPVNTVRSRKLLAIRRLRTLLADVFESTFGTAARGGV